MLSESQQHIYKFVSIFLKDQERAGQQCIYLFPLEGGILGVEVVKEKKRRDSAYSPCQLRVKKLKCHLLSRRDLISEMTLIECVEDYGK
jgi:hypothetical protein